jgi:hypothetical protein
MCLAIALLLPLQLAAYADVIELKTGQIIEGTLTQATQAHVSIDVGGQTITVEGKKVRAIYFDVLPTSTGEAGLGQFALWETEPSYYRQPKTKLVEIFGSHAACERTAARLSQTSASTYRCLPYVIPAAPGLAPLR